jgi:hypothetical protein
MRIPENAGSTRGPMEKTVIARNPTVKAWGDAPQIPGAMAVREAQIPSSCGYYCPSVGDRINAGKLVCTPPVFAGARKIRRA